MAGAPIGSILGGILVSSASGQINFGAVVVDQGGNVWVPWSQGGSSLTGRQIGVCATNLVMPGGPIQVLVSGALPYDAFNVGPGNSSNIVAGNTPSRGTAGTIIGVCDASGSITIIPPNSVGSSSTVSGYKQGQQIGSLANGLNSNIQTGGQSSLLASGPSAAFSIGGFTQATGAAVAGQTLLVVNTTTQPMTIVHEDTSSTAQNRIDTLSGQPVTLAPGVKTSAAFVYNGTTSRWVLQNSGITRIDVLHAKDFGATGNGVTDDSAAVLAAANAAAAANAVSNILHFDTGTYVFASSQTLPIGVIYRFAGGAMLSPNTGQTITINGTVDCGLTQCFTGAGTIAFGVGATPIVRPEWFPQTVTSSSCPVQLACNAAHPAKIPVVLSSTIPGYTLATGAVGLTITNPYGTIQGNSPPTSFGYVVTGATGNGVSPIVLTINASGVIPPFIVGQMVDVRAVLGNTAANGIQQVQAWNAGTGQLTLQGTTGNGAYTSGGVAYPYDGAFMTYNGTGTGIQIGQNVGVGNDFIEGVRMENVRLMCAETASVGLDAWSPSKNIYRSVNIWGLSGASSIVCRVRGAISTKFDSCAFQANGSQPSSANWGTCFSYSQAAGSQGTTTVLDNCYLNYGSLAVLCDGSFLNLRNSVLESSLRGFQVQNTGSLALDQCWIENCGTASSNELFGKVDATSFVELNACINNATSACLKGFTTAAGCKIRIRGGRVFGTGYAIYLFAAAEIGATSDVQMSGWSLEGTTGSYNSTDTKAITGETPDWRTVRFTDLDVIRYDFVQKAVVGTQAATNMGNAFGTADQGYRLTGNPNWAPGGGRILGMHWSYSGNIASGTIRVQVYDGATNVLDSGAVGTAVGEVHRSALSAPAVDGDTLGCKLTTASLVNAGGDLVVSVFIGYGDVCGA